MRRFLTLIIFVIASIALGLIMHRYPGYVLIHFNNTSVETTLWFAVIVLFLLISGIVLSLKFVRGVGSLSNKFSLWSGQRKQQKSHRQTIDGINALIMGDTSLAEKKFAKPQRDEPLMPFYYLTAANCAQSLNKIKARDSYLKKALQTGEQHNSTTIIKAQLLIQNQEYKSALTVLDKLDNHFIEKPNPLLLKAQVCLALNKWQPFNLAINKLINIKSLDADQISGLAIEGYQLQLQNSSAKKLADTWKSIPTSLQQQSELLLSYCQKLIATKSDSIAEALLKKTLNKSWDDQLFACFSILNIPADKKLKSTKRWIGDQSSNPQALALAGKIALEATQLKLAKQLSIQSNKLLESTLAYDTLANIMLNEGDRKLAISYFQKALSL